MGPSSASSNLLFGATAAVGGGNAFQRLILASGTVESVLIAGRDFTTGSAGIGARDVGGAATGVSVVFGPGVASCTPAACDVAFDGGAFELSSRASALILGSGSSVSSVSAYEARFTYAVAAVPEPGSVALVGSGLLLLGAAARRRR